MVKRDEFPSASTGPKAFKQLIDKPKSPVKIKGSDDFSGMGLKIPTQNRPNEEVSFSENEQKSASTNEVQGKKRRGRPVEIQDSRFKVTVPKKISPATVTKLAVLEEYVTELSSETGRITFDKLINALADAYVQKNLGVAKEEVFKGELREAMDHLPKK